MRSFDSEWHMLGPVRGQVEDWRVRQAKVRDWRLSKHVKTGTGKASGIPIGVRTRVETPWGIGPGTGPLRAMASGLSAVGAVDAILGRLKGGRTAQWACQNGVCCFSCYYQRRDRCWPGETLGSYWQR